MVEFKDYENTQGLEELEGWRYFPIRAANRIKSFWESNSVLSYLRRHRLKRTMIISYALLVTMVWTATSAYFSPTRVTYLESQLQATQSFGNGLGSITATSMTYSSSNGLVVMELTTSDATSAIKKGINTENLDWQVFLPSSVKNPEAVTLEVIPLTGDKVYLVLRNVPSDYTLMVIRATNKTPNSNSLKIDVQEYNDYLSSSSNDASVSKQNQQKDKEGNKNYVDFFVTPQNELLNNKYVKNLSREKFALNIFEEELKYQKGQRKELLASAKTLDDSIKEDTKVVIVDAAAINSIDITAADRLEMMAENFERKGIKFYITEHSENVNEQMRKLGIGHLIEEGKVRRTILAALQDAGIPSMGTTAGADKARDPLVWMPCQLEIPAAVHAVHEAMVPAEEENTLEEFAWAFGDDAVEEMEKKVHQVMEQIHKLPDLERLADVGFEEKLKNWHSLGVLDEDEILRRMEMHLDELPENLRGDRKMILQLIEKRRRKIEQQLLLHHPEIVEHLKKSAWKNRIRRQPENCMSGKCRSGRRKRSNGRKK